MSDDKRPHHTYLDQDGDQVMQDSEQFSELSVDEVRAKRLRRFANNQKTTTTTSSTPQTASTKMKNISNDANIKSSSGVGTAWRNQLTAAQRFIHETIAKSLRVTIGSKREGSSLFHLEQCTAFAMNDHQFPFFTENMIEMALVERLAHHMETPDAHSTSPIVYLIQCYRNAHAELLSQNQKNQQQQQQVSLSEGQEQKIAFLRKMCDLIVLYTGHVLLYPDMFPQSQPVRQQGSLVLLPFLSADNEYGTNALPDGFLDDLVKNLASKPGHLDQVFVPVFTEVREQIKNKTALNRYIGLVNTLERLTKHPDLCRVLLRHEHWLAKKSISTSTTSQASKDNHPTGQLVQQMSYLGPFFGVVSFFREPGFEKVNESYFAHNIDRMTQRELDSIHATLRMELKVLHTVLHRIMLNLLKPSDTRGRVLQWIAQVLEGNHTRTKMRPNMHIASSEGFLANFNVVMLKLCEPFVGRPDQRHSSVNPNFIMSNPLVDFKEDTKIAMAKSEALEWYEKHRLDQQQQQEDEEDYNFVTQCFFLTYQSLRISTLKCLEVYLNAMQDLQRLQSRLRRAQSAGGVGEFDLQMMRRAMQEGLRYRFGAETVLMDRDLMKSIMSFYRFAAYWLVRLADPQLKGPPLAPPPPPHYAAMPDFFIEGISRYVNFLTHVYPEGLTENPMDEIFDLMVYFIGDKHYIKNPYTRATFPEILAGFTPDINKHMPEMLRNIVFRNSLMKQHLMGGIMQLYVDLEHTGESHQFYSKFNYRYHISVLLRYLWNDDAYKRSFAQVCREGSPVEYVKFFNMLLNDMTYLLEESLEKLVQIRQIQIEMANRETWNALSREAREERESNLQLAERITKSSMLLARENANSIRYLSHDIPEPFMRPELVDKVASMLNSFIEKLAGPRCQDLKVDQMEKYHFEPRVLLTHITDAYINFSKFEQFIDAIARDERYFKTELFESVSHILQRRINKPDTYVQQFRELTRRAMEKAGELSAMDEDFGEAPDDFLDQIFYTLMSDPVQLPSGQIVDRSTIERHLLNDPTNPFTRAPLTLEECTPDTALKQRIEEWKTQKRSERQ